jgi:3-oxoadipate enol-lactonase
VPFTRGNPRVYYERSGAGEPLLFITGFTISAAVFERILPLYEPKYECITFDNRGSGRSDAPRRLTSMPELAADARRLLDTLDIDSAHVYGVSMGGMIAQELAIRFPERVRGLILGGTWSGGPRAIRPALRDLAVLGAASTRALREPGRPYLASALFSADFRRRQPERVRELLEPFRRYRAPPQGMLAQLLATVYHDTFSRLELIRAPTLVMHGELDAIAPLANARLLAERIPDAELAIVPGSGHAYGLERPQDSMKLMLDWLTRRGPIAGGPPRTGPRARLEPVARRLGLPIGALRTGASLVGLASDRRAQRARRPSTRSAEDPLS